MPTYCECGGGEPKAGLEHSAYKITLDTISTVAPTAGVYGMMAGALAGIVGEVVDLDAFCLIVPPQPPIWTLALLAVPGSAQATALAWFWYLVWQHDCQCKSTSLSPVEVDYPEIDFGNYVAAGGGRYDAWKQVGGPNHYKVELSYNHAGPWRLLWEGDCAIGLWIRYIYPDWDCPTGKCGRGWFETYCGDGDMAAVSGDWAGTTKAHLTQPSGRDAIRWTIGSACSPTVPPVLTPAEPTGYTEPDPPACTTVADVCATLFVMQQQLAKLAATAVGVAWTNAGSIVMTGDDHSSVLADAMLLEVADIPVWASKQGTDQRYYGPWEHPEELGWVAAGNPSGWFPPVAIHWASQWLGDLPPDTSRLTWHLLQGITVTATLFVRGGQAGA